MKTLRSILVALLLTAVVTAPVLAQAALTLDVRKDFGFNLGGQIRGIFSMKASGPSDLKSVTFYIDGKAVKQVSAAPFTMQFQTTDYAVGVHELSATGETTGGQTLTSPVRRFEFISAQAEQGGMAKVVVPLLGIVAVVFLVMMGVQLLLFRKRKLTPVPLGTQRNYGLRGGAICPRCGRPTPLHWSAMNIGIATKLDFCDNCGRYGALHRRSLQELRRAEEAELKEARAQTPIFAPTAEETLKEQLDSSRYEETK